MIGFVASGISTKSSLSATSAFHGGGVLGRAGTGATTHTGLTDILILLIRPSTPGYGYEYGNQGYGYGSPGYLYVYNYPYGSYYGSYYNGTNSETDDQGDMRNV